MTETNTARPDAQQPLTDNAERMVTWCRMWSEDPALAYRLMAPDCRQWSGQTTGLDAVTGPAEQVPFVQRYRAEHINVFTPRVLVDAGDAFAYTWDVRLPDGTLHTGMDVNTVGAGFIVDNWTFVGPHSADPDPGGVEPTETAVLARLASERIDELARTCGQLVTMHRRPVLDPGHGRFAVLRSVTTADGGTVGGADLVTVRGGAVDQVWAFTGTRAFRY